MYKLVVFDLDGTLANTLVDLASAVNTALSQYDLPLHPVEKYNNFVGNGINNLITQVLMDKGCDKELHKKVKDYFDFYYPQHLCDNTTPYEGMSALLDKLSQLGVSTAVHSNKPHCYVPQILSKLYPNHKFDIAWGQQECFERKPSPQAVTVMMDKLSVNPCDTLYVGDSDVDVMTAHNASIKVCGVEWGFRGKEELLLAGADFVVKDAEELLRVVIEG